MTVTLDWLGCATFRLTFDDLVVYLDAYIDRVPSAPAVGLTAAQVDRADYVLVGHSHFDHLAGSEVIARNTGATVIGSHETVRVLREAGVPPAQLVASQGGEHHRLAPGVSVRVFPSLHSCIWVGGSWDVTQAVTGHYGLTEEERAAVRARSGGGIGEPPAAPDAHAAEEMREHLRTALGSQHIGGALAFLIETPEGSVFYHDTSGCFTGVVGGLRPDVAIVAMAGRPNLDGEPIQGSLVDFVTRMADLMRPRRLVLGHHDDWMPPMTRDMATPEATAAVRDALARVAPRTELVTMGYLAGVRIL
jgi:L-ascorbate metabolism protein UlaG (beta-lactamase superfamily)